MKCPKCNSEIANDSKFCEFCGAKVAVESIDVKKGMSNPNTKKYLRFALGVMVGIIICVVVAVIGTNKLDGRSDSEGISENVEDTLVAPVEKSILEREKLKAQGWVDLGLPSGTLWKNVSEDDYYTYNEAVRIYGKYLPTKEQWNELIQYCQWTWSGWKTNNDVEGYWITGNNGKSMFLPNYGEKVAIRDYDLFGYGQNGLYWSLSLSESGGPYCLSAYRTYCDNHQLEENEIMIHEFDSINLRSVRLAY